MLLPTGPPRWPQETMVSSESTPVSGFRAQTSIDAVSLPSMLATEVGPRKAEPPLKVTALPPTPRPSRSVDTVGVPLAVKLPTRLPVLAHVASGPAGNPAALTLTKRFSGT